MIKTTKLLFFFAFALFNVTVFAQGDEEPEPPPPPPPPPPAETVDTTGPVRYYRIDGALTSVSAKMEDGRSYEYLPVSMQAGDKIVISYVSKDFITAIAVMDTLGHSFQEVDEPVAFESFGSTIDIPYHATVAGLYNFIFTSKNPGTLGKFTVHAFVYEKAKSTLTNDSPFCDKLRYLANSSQTAFEFLKPPYNYKQHKDFHKAELKLIPAANNRVQSTLGGRYLCDIAVSSNLDSLNTVFDELEKAIGDCLPDHVKKVMKKEDETNFGQKGFFRKVRFILEGKHAYDLNLHFDKFKNRVVLIMNQTSNGKYELEIVIE